MDKKKKAIIALAVSVLLLTGYFSWKWLFGRDSLIVEASGTVEATTVELTAKVAGTIESIEVKAGARVKENELVAKISRSDLAAQRERDALNVLIAQNKLADLLSGARAQEIKEAAANVNIQQASYDKSQRDLERAEVLFQEGSIAQVELEGYEKNNIVAFNQLEAAQAKLNLLQAGSRDEQIKAAENQVKMLEAVLKASEAVLADLKIYSPLQGTIQSRNYEIGEFVLAGASLLTVANLEKLWINVYLPTDDLPFVKLGQKAQVTISGIDAQFTGEIVEIATRGEFTPKTIQTKKERANIVYKVKIEVENQEGVLKPGMPADVIIEKLVEADAKMETEQSTPSSGQEVLQP